MDGVLVCLAVQVLRVSAKVPRVCVFTSGFTTPSAAVSFKSFPSFNSFVNFLVLKILLELLL